MAGRPRTLPIPIFGVLTKRRGASESARLEAEVIQLFDQMRGRIMRYALSFGLSMADAEEILQDVFLALYQHLSRGESGAGLHGWLFRVTHNLSLKRRLAIQRTPAEPMTPEAERESTRVVDPQPNPEELLAFGQRQRQLRLVVNALSEMDQKCLHLRAEGLRYREIADVLEISVGSVANSLVRSLARLSRADERIG